MEQVSRAVAEFLGNALIESVLVVLVSYAIYRGLSNILLGKNRKIKLNLNIGGRSKTYLRLAQNILRYVFAVVTVLIVLQINNVDVSSILAGVGLAGAVVGVAAQDALKDIIRGTTIISDQYFSVGDVLRYGKIEGKVLVVGLKTTKIQDIDSEDIISISNRDINEARVVSTCLNLEIPLPYELPTKRALSIMDEITALAKQSALVSDCENQGANALNDSAIAYKLRVTCRPELRNAARRAVIAATLATVEKHHISIPYQQIDIHQKA